MLTRSFLNLMSAMPQSSSTALGTMPIKDVYGMQYFHVNQFSFPYARTETYTNNAYAAGISVGSCGDPESENDYNLREHLSSAVSVSVASRTLTYDGCAALNYILTVTNTSSEDVTIAEVGYKQTCRGTVAQGHTAAVDVIVLMDRTVVSPSITLRPGQTCSIDYRLETLPWGGVDNGVKIVSWQFGSDDDVAAMIDAAHDGLIDLKDHWAVGDVRTIDVAAFTGGGDVSHAAQKADIVITSFDDYNGCGAVMQVDFANALAAPNRMSGTSTNYGSYGITEMANTTLPALANSLPSWLKSRMMTFDVYVSAGNMSTDVGVVSGNRLALRSEVEVTNSTNSSQPGEGTQIPWYVTIAKMRQKRAGRTGGNVNWWMRSPIKNHNANFAFMRGDGTSCNASDPTTAQYIAPFMCL